MLIQGYLLNVKGLNAVLCVAVYKRFIIRTYILEQNDDLLFNSEQMYVIYVQYSGNIIVPKTDKEVSFIRQEEDVRCI